MASNTVYNDILNFAKQNLPSGWSIKRAKSCINSKESGKWGEEAHVESFTIPCLRAADFDYKNLTFVPQEQWILRSYNETKIKNSLLTENDILVEKSGGGETTPVGRAILVTQDLGVAYSNFMERLRVNTDIISAPFFHYWWTGWYQNGWFRLNFNQTTGIQNLDINELLEKHIVMIPPKELQEVIVAYLNRNCALIQQKINDHILMIEKLEEYKRSLIAHVVIKGLDDSVAMKDSGVKWIGEIPANWEVVQFRSFSSLVSKSGYPAEELLSVYLNYGVVKFSDMGDKRVHNPSEELSSYQLVEPGNLVLNNQQAWRGSVGVSEYRGIVSPAYFVLKFNLNRVSPRYMHYLCRYPGVPMFELNSRGVGSIQRNLAIHDLLRENVALPSLNEQIQIASYLDKKSNLIARAISAQEQLISKLEEYKKSLIFHAVTGKIDCSEV